MQNEKQERRENGVYIKLIMSGEAVIDIVTEKGTVTKRADVDDLGKLLASVAADDMILPPSTLFCNRDSGTYSVCVVIPAGIHHWIKKDEETFIIPMPTLLFGGNERTYYLAAIREDWPTAETAVYYPPTPNVYNGLNICPGSNPYPTCTPASIYEAWQMTVESYWSGDYTEERLSTGKLGDLWERLRGEQEFPLGLLRPANITVGDLRVRIAGARTA